METTMKSIKPLARSRRLIVFQVRDRQKVGNFGIYVGDTDRGNMTRAEDIFVLEAAADCRVSQWKKGQHLLISDAFELEPVDLRLWDENAEDPAFEKLRKFAEKVQGRVHTSIVHEDSILGEVEGDHFQEDTQW